MYKDKYSKSNIYKHAKKVTGDNKEDRRHDNRGRPIKITEDVRTIVREVHHSRETDRNIHI